MAQQYGERPTARTDDGAARLSGAATLRSHRPHRPRETFAAEVGRRIEGPVLRQSQRRTLLATARRLGIPRFEANLVIAMVQHQRTDRKPPPSVPIWLGQGPIPRHGGAVVLFLIVQTFIVWGACRVWLG